MAMTRELKMSADVSIMHVTSRFISRKAKQFGCACISYARCCCRLQPFMHVCPDRRMRFLSLMMDPMQSKPSGAESIFRAPCQ